MWVESPFNIMANQMTSSTWTVVKTSKFFFVDTVKCYAKTTKNSNILHLEVSAGGHFISKGYYPLSYRKNGAQATTPLKTRIGVAVLQHEADTKEIMVQYSNATKKVDIDKLALKAKTMLNGLEVKFFLVYKLLVDQDGNYILKQEIMLYDGENEDTAEAVFSKEDIRKVITNEDTYTDVLKEYGLIEDDIKDVFKDLQAVDSKGGFLLSIIIGREETNTIKGASNIIEKLDAIHARGGKAFNNYVEEIRMSSAI